MAKIIRAVDQDYKINVGPNGSITLSAGSIKIAGDLVVNGTTTTVTTEDLIVKDNLIVLNNGETGAGVTKGTAGIEINRGTLPEVRLIFKEADSKFIMEYGTGSAVSLKVETIDAAAIDIRNISGPIPLATEGVLKLWSTDPGQGGTGFYFVNTSNSPDELISRRKALAYSIIF